MITLFVNNDNDDDDDDNDNDDNMVHPDLNMWEGWVVVIPVFKVLRFDVLAERLWNYGESGEIPVKFWWIWWIWWKSIEIMMKLWQKSGRVW